MVDIIRYIFVMTIIGVGSAFVVAVMHEKTLPGIEAQDMAAQRIALQETLLPGMSVTECKGTTHESPEKFWVGMHDNKAQAYAFELKTQGYANEIKMLISLDTAGRILGVSILDQNETPGLGSRITEVVSKHTFWNPLISKESAMTPWFMQQFKGLSVLKPIQPIKNLGEWQTLAGSQRVSLRNENRVTALTGATISSRAITHALETQGVAYFKAIRIERP